MKVVFAPTTEINITVWIGKDSLAVSGILVALANVQTPIRVKYFHVIFQGTNPSDIFLFFYLVIINNIPCRPYLLALHFSKVYK